MPPRFLLNTDLTSGECTLREIMNDRCGDKGNEKSEKVQWRRNNKLVGEGPGKFIMDRPHMD
jgi:hypothetical protein